MATIADHFPRYLYTDRLTLELYNRNDKAHTDALLASINSPTAIARMGDLGVKTVANLDAMIRRSRLRNIKFTSGGEADQALSYMIRVGNHRPEGALAGNVSLAQRVVSTSTGPVTLPPDAGWSMLEEHMGKGYATEAATRLLHFVREDYGERDVIVFPSATNRQSNRVAEKLGFVDGGRCPDLDNPGEMVGIWISPGMQRIDSVLKDGISFHLKDSER